MPDIQFFDAAGFFAHKISEVEQVLIGKKAELEILLANRRNLESAITTLALLTPEHQRAIQSELASLKEVLSSTERAISVLEGEIEVLTGKLGALQAARNLLEVQESSPKE
jgi:chromosome segregation ATPase